MLESAIAENTGYVRLHAQQREFRKTLADLYSWRLFFAHNAATVEGAIAAYESYLALAPPEQALLSKQAKENIRTLRLDASLSHFK
jgi:hypothetical protein